MKKTRRSTPRPRWETGELDFLRVHYEFMSNMDLSKNLGRSTKAIFMKAQELGLMKGHTFRREQGRKNIANRYNTSPAP
jgi:hypothetical protein